jgi:diguanylate cyclase (GGDEF)-like protein
MLNKIFHKFAALLILVIIVFLAFILFIIFPKIQDFFYEFEMKHVNTQLKNIEQSIEFQSQDLQRYEELAFKAARAEIVRMTQTAHGIMESFYEDYEDEKLSLNQAREAALKTIQKIKFSNNENDYIFVLDTAGKYYVHPNKDIVGEIRINAQDITGKYVNQEIIKNTVKNQSAYTTYFWPKRNRDIAYKKISYSMYFEPLKLIIATGIYVDDIQKQNRRKAYAVMSKLKKVLDKHKILNDGSIIISTNTNFVLSEDKYEKELKNNTKLLKQIKQAYLENKPFYYSLNQQRKMGLVAYNEYFKWYIVTCVDEEELHSKSNELNGIILNVTLIGLFLMFIFGLFMIRKVVWPIKELSRNALKVKEGNFEVRNRIVSNDEIGILAQQFNVMLDTIEDNIKNLEEKIDLRTKKLQHQLYYDDLTGLKNRVSFMQDTKDAYFSTLILLDINDFDDINELYGYKIGNEVLIKFTQFLQPYCEEKNNTLYRIYGNTFAILSKSELFNFEEFETFVHDMLAQIKKYPIPIDELNIELFVDATLGIAICQDSALKKANIALRKAKKSNSSFFVFNNEVDTKKVIENTIFWRNKIKDAVDSNKIVPFFQPIVNQDQHIVKYETLMRLEDENQKGIISHISPYKFMDISIKTKQYSTISNMLVGKALDALETTDKSLSINLSFTDINDAYFLNFIEQKLSTIDSKHYSRLVFEILESDGILNYDTLENFINKYRKMGIKIAIDDFGTGYSNFSHIMKIRPDYLKIDASLIKNIDTNSDSYELVKSIVVFSKALKIKTIAEFVHSKEVFDITLSLGIDEFQGYYFGKPESQFVEELVKT